MKKTAQKIAFVFIVVIIASTATSCIEVAQAVMSVPGELIVGAASAPAQNKEKQKRRQEEQELSDRIAKYDDVDTFGAENTNNFTESAKTSGTATIIFEPRFPESGLQYVQKLVFVELLQRPEEAKQLSDKLLDNRYQFPAGIELNIRLYILFRGGDYSRNEPGYRRRGIFKCPPLEAGKTYKLWFESPRYYIDRDNGGGSLILTNDNIRNNDNGIKTARRRSLHIQEIPPFNVW